MTGPLTPRHPARTTSQSSAQGARAVEEAPAGPVVRARKGPLAGAALGTLVEFYDFGIYALTVPVIAAAFFPSASSAAGLLYAFAVFGIAFLVRPLGGVVFGALGDRLGRRAVLTMVLGLIGLSTTAVAVLPTYADAGVLAPTLLVRCRVVQGLSAGGEVTSATSFALEHAPRQRRATAIGVVVAMSAAASVVALVVVLLTGQVLGAETYAQWGWRVPFLLALPLSLVGLYVRLRTEESPEFIATRGQSGLSRHPVLDSLRSNRSAIGFCFTLAALMSLGFYVLVGLLPTYLQTTAGLTRGAALASNGAALLVFVLGAPLAGALADRLGRRPLILAGAAGTAVVAVPAFWLAGSGGLAGAVAGQLLLTVTLSLFAGGAFAAQLELFPVRTRLSGAAIGYNAGYALLGGTAPLVGNALVQQTGQAVAPGVYLTLVAVLVLLVALRLPETMRRPQTQQAH